MKKLLLILLAVLALITFVACPPKSPITITSPQTGDNVTLDQVFQIKWKYTDELTTFNIALIKLDQTEEPIATGLTPTGGNGTYDWTPTGYTEGSGYKIKITSGEESATSGAFSLVAAGSTWEVTYDNTTFSGGGQKDSSSRIALDTEGNIYVAGTSYDDTNQVVWLVKLGTNGTKIWDVTLTPTPTPRTDGLAVIGDAIYLGISLQDSGTSVNSILIQKYKTSDGSAYGGTWPAAGRTITSTQHGSFLNDLIVIGDAIYLSGVTDFFNGGASAWAGDWAIHKLNTSDGANYTGWTTNPVTITYGQAGDEDDMSYAIVSDANNIYASGRYWSGSSTTHYNLGMASIAQTDGTINWGANAGAMFTATPDDKEIPNDMVIDSNGNLIAVAEIVRTGTSPNYLYGKLWLISVNSTNHTVNWENSGNLIGAESGYTYVHSLAMVTDNTNLYIVGSQSDTTDPTIPDVATINKVSATNGQPVAGWAVTYTNSESNGFNEFDDIIITENYLIVAGTIFKDATKHDIWIKKLLK